MKARAMAGSIFDGTDLRAHLPRIKSCGLGLAQVPEGRRVFARMTVQENLEMGAYIRRDKDQVLTKDSQNGAMSACRVWQERRKQHCAARSRAASSRCLPLAAR